MFQVNKSYFIQHLRKVFITKAILLSDSSHDNNYVVVLIFGYLSRLAFCKKGDSGWTILSGASQSYCDIIYFNDLFYALTWDSSIEVWDFHASLPIKKREIHPSTTREMLEATKCFRNLHSCQTYLVESSSDLLLVLRYIGNFVNQEGKVIDEAYLLSGDSTQPLVCPYQTLMFHVCKLDSSEQKWVGVDNLTDEVFFLRGNHSMSLSAQYCSRFEKNSIYFTDDNWNQMNEDDLNRGHDLGKFSFEEKIVKPLMNFHLDRAVMIWKSNYCYYFE
ncbi:hypothetical protein GH714_033627 [Hevea brasiliensis]|uniref:KIB1-4 beta-propeller domain-containing protein n=1 Tax=Hevea brasiliensis TaxID=3981 RepID=A0A6A6N8B0_HEVBR|nr:hypothetical protein GH714_033627 [Hevea brasiliensis]